MVWFSLNFGRKEVPTPFQPHFSGYLVENFHRYRVLHQRWSWAPTASNPEPEPEPTPRFQNKMEEAPSFNGKTFKQSSVLRTYPSHITCLTFVGCYTEYPNHKRNGFLSLQISSNIWNILHEALSTPNDILFFIDLFVLSLDFEKEFEAKLEKGRKWKWYYP